MRALRPEQRQRLVSRAWRALRAMLGIRLSCRVAALHPALDAEAAYQGFLAGSESAGLLEVPARAPLVSLVVPVFAAPERFLRAALQSVLDQSYPHWELCAADAGPAGSPGSRALAAFAARDARIHVIALAENRGIAGNTNAARAEAGGEWLAFLDQDDLLAPDALALMVDAIEARPSADVVYSDKDNVTPWGDRYAPYFKPDFSPHLLLASNYLAHLTLARRSLVEAAGGFDPAADGAQDWDLLLRLAERTSSFLHVPRVLYHWRSLPSSAASSLAAKPWAQEAQRRTLQAALERRGIPARVEIDAHGAPRFRATGADERSDLRVFHDPRLTPRDASWVAELAVWARRPGVGAACGMLLDARGRVACAGLALVEGRARPLFAGARLDQWTPLGRPCFLRDVLAPTPGAVVVRRELFERLGGAAPLDARAAIDLGLKIHAAGLRTVVAPSAVLLAPGDATITSEATWSGSDPYWSKHLDPRSSVPRPRVDRR
jgi:GT2 family glycosyltransferase